MIYRLADKIMRSLVDAYPALRFVVIRAGREYGITRIQKLRLVIKFVRNNKGIPSLSTWRQQLLLAEELFLVPKSLEGDVVEAGCYAGASTASLSLACQLVDRKLYVCDSFEGLPLPREDEKYTVVGDTNQYYLWQKGEYSVAGGLDAVKDNVREFGDIEVCEFAKGYFQDTLKDVGSHSFVLVFEDADLPSSVEDCLRHLWPRLQEECKFFSHEPFSLEVMSLFFDKSWWKENLNSPPPGFVGSGSGLGVRGVGQIGYAKKLAKGDVISQGRRMVHEGTRESVEA